VVWDLRLIGDPGGPPSITGTARFMTTTSYIAITPLSGHTAYSGFAIASSNYLARAGRLILRALRHPSPGIQTALYSRRITITTGRHSPRQTDEVTEYAQALGESRAMGANALSMPTGVALSYRAPERGRDDRDQ